MALKITQVDAFSDQPFGGNPAAVCVLPAARDERWMQHLAREMNLSETAFLLAQGDGFVLRWFTPAVEVDLCGHATLASAHVLWEDRHLSPGQQARFHTRSGLLTADRSGDWIEMDFPVEPPRSTEPPPGLAEGLGVALRYVGRNRFDFIVEVESEAVVRGLAPDMKALSRVESRGVMVTSRAQPGRFDFVSRFFAPAAGIDEDPVTGSAHCCLGPYWRDILGKDDLLAYQASARGGVVRVRMAGDRVKLGGQAVTVMRGELTC